MFALSKAAAFLNIRQLLRSFPAGRRIHDGVRFSIQQQYGGRHLRPGVAGGFVQRENLPEYTVRRGVVAKDAFIHLVVLRHPPRSSGTLSSACTQGQSEA